MKSTVIVKQQGMTRTIISVCGGDHLIKVSTQPPGREIAPNIGTNVTQFFTLATKS